MSNPADPVREALAELVAAGDILWDGYVAHDSRSTQADNFAEKMTRAREALATPAPTVALRYGPFDAKTQAEYHVCENCPQPLGRGCDAPCKKGRDYDSDYTMGDWFCDLDNPHGNR